MNLIVSGLHNALVPPSHLVPTLTAILNRPAHPDGSGRCIRIQTVDCTPAQRATIATVCADGGVDHAWIDANLQLDQFALLVMDMDSTLITIECIDEIADLYGKKQEVAAITEAAMRGEITDFTESLRRRVGLLAGLNAHALDEIYASRLKLSPGAERMLRELQRAGLRTLLVSGGFTFFSERLKARLGLDYTRANTLEIIDGNMTGRVVGPIIDGDAKAEAVRETCRQLGIETHRAIVIGDGANDLKMMSLAGMSIAYHAKPVVSAQAHQSIRYGGLDVLLDWFHS